MVSLYYANPPPVNAFAPSRNTPHVEPCSLLQKNPFLPEFREGPIAFAREVKIW